eukprot:208220-Pyramimonas_sp.AAC.1
MTVKAHFEYEDILKCQRARAHNLWAIARRKSLQMTRSMLAKRRKQIVRMHYSAYLIQRNFRRWILRVRGCALTHSLNSLGNTH